MKDVWQQAGPTIIWAIFSLVCSIPMIWVWAPWRRGMQFSLRTILLWVVPLLAVAAWIASWGGPFFSPRRVLTPKMGALVLWCSFVEWAIWMRFVRAMSKAGTKRASRPADE